MKWLLRPWCWLVGHKEINRRVNVRKYIALMHLCTLAGMDFDCARCGLEWRDSGISDEEWEKNEG